MSALSERLAAEHQFAWGPTTDGGAVPSCTCQPGVRVDDWPAHLIAATEAAVRAQIAADIEAKPRDLVLPLTPMAVGDSDLPTWMHGAIAGVLAAARIAKGGA